MHGLGRSDRGSRGSLIQCPPCAGWSAAGNRRDLPEYYWLRAPPRRLIRFSAKLAKRLRDGQSDFGLAVEPDIDIDGVKPRLHVQGVIRGVIAPLMIYPSSVSQPARSVAFRVISQAG